MVNEHLWESANVHAFSPLDYVLLHSMSRGNVSWYVKDFTQDNNNWSSYSYATNSLEIRLTSQSSIVRNLGGIFRFKKKINGLDN